MVSPELQNGCLRLDREGTGGLLRNVPALPALVRADSRKRRGRGGDHGGQHLSQAAKDGPDACRRGSPGAPRHLGNPALANSGRHAQRGLAGEHAQPAGFLPESPLAEPLDVGRAARLSQGRMVAGGIPSDGAVGPCRPALPGGCRHGTRPVPPRLQQGPGRTNLATPAWPFLPGRDRASALLLPAISHPATHPEGPANLLARSGPVVAILDLLRAARILLPEHTPARLRALRLPTGATS